MRYLFSDGSIITKAVESKFIAEVQDIKSRVELAQLIRETRFSGSINEMLNIDSEYNDKLKVDDGELVYIEAEVSSQEIKWLRNLGIKKLSQYFMVSFDTNGAGDIAEQSIKDGKLAKKPKAPKKSGMEFVGWFYKSEDDSDIAFDFNNQVTQNYSLFAKYFWGRGRT